MHIKNKAGYIEYRFCRAKDSFREITETFTTMMTRLDYLWLTNQAHIQIF